MRSLLSPLDQIFNCAERQRKIFSAKRSADFLTKLRSSAKRKIGKSFPVALEIFNHGAITVS
jgi:hypothetical protein